jgi:hypothetical protein
MTRNWCPRGRIADHDDGARASASGSDDAFALADRRVAQFAMGL